jgi:hypothetical protein
MNNEDQTDRQPQVATSAVVCVLKVGDIRQAGDEYFDGKWRAIPEDRYGLPIFPDTFPHRRVSSHTAAGQAATRIETTDIQNDEK